MDNVVSAGGGLGGLLMSIAGAGSGMAHSAEDSISKNQAAELKRIEEDHQAQIAEDKAKALTTWNLNEGARVGNEQKGLLASKFGDENTRLQDLAILAKLHNNKDYQGDGADQQDVSKVSQMTDEALNDNALTPREKSDIQVQAGLNVGAIDPSRAIELAKLQNASDSQTRASG